jgi:glycosyltransferase involved in cell wall biosynthesis
MAPKISVILPTYNGEYWLAESIQSIIDQTEKNWQLIIVDDGSVDNSLKIAQSFMAKDQRISVISNRINRQLPASLNIGFSLAQGEYLTWTSDDNIYKPNALEKMAAYLDNHSQTDLVSMNFSYIDENGKIKFEDFDALHKYKRDAAYLLHGCNIGAAFMYRKTIADKVGKYDENKFCAEDYDYWCRMALIGKIDYRNDNIYYYRQHRWSLSATKKPQIKAKTIQIKNQYAEAFFIKFNFDWWDKATFWYNVKNYKRAMKYLPYYVFLAIYKYVTNLLVMPIFWDKSIRHKLRRIIRISEKYSFSTKKSYSKI